MKMMILLQRGLFALLLLSGCASGMAGRNLEAKIPSRIHTIKSHTVPKSIPLRKHQALYPTLSRRSILLARFPWLGKSVPAGGVFRGARLEEALSLILPSKTRVAWGDISPDLRVNRSIMPDETRYDALERILHSFGGDFVPYPDHVLITRTWSRVFRVPVPNIRNIVMNTVGNTGSSGMPGAGGTGLSPGMSSTAGGTSGAGMSGMNYGAMMPGMTGGMMPGMGTTGTSQTGSNGSVSVTSVGGFSTLWDRMEKTLQKMLPKASIAADSKSQTVTVRGSVSDVFLAQRYLDIVRGQLRKQVFFKIDVAEVDLSDSNAFGINWNALASGVLNSSLALTGAGASNAGLSSTGTITTPYGAAFGSTAVIQALEQIGRVHILNQPYVGTISGQPVSLNATTDIPYLQGEYPFFAGGLSSASEVIPQFGYAPIGVNLELVPTVEGDQVHLEGTVVVNTLEKMVTINIQGLGQFQNPEINSRSQTTEITARDGQTVVIGGLMSNNRTKNFWTVPVLGHIPVLKWLFSGYDYETQVTELVIIITPEIRESPQIPSPSTGDLLDPDGELYQKAMPGAQPFPVPRPPSVPR